MNDVSEQMTRRVLHCLSVRHTNDPRTARTYRSLAEIAGLYNQIYPPQKRKFKFFPISLRTIHGVLRELVREKLVGEEVFSIVELETLPGPTKYYSLTQAGQQYLGVRKK